MLKKEEGPQINIRENRLERICRLLHDLSKVYPDRNILQIVIDAEKAGGSTDETATRFEYGVRCSECDAVSYPQKDTNFFDRYRTNERIEKVLSKYFETTHL